VRFAAILTFLCTSAFAQIVAPDTTADGPEIAHTDVSIEWNGSSHRCLEQVAQPFLIRKNWWTSGDAKAAVQRAIDYRTEQYGRFEKFGGAGLNTRAPKDFATTLTFMGLSITVHERMAPALRCAEAALKALKLDEAYKPKSAGGMRFKNTYRGNEVSNHVFGIAIDIESNQNTCCSCVAPWPDHPLCKKKVSSIYERMTMPRSWVIVFERYGFYWLGHDALQDTMHFEFLGDPTKIVEGQAVAGAPANGASSSIDVLTGARAGAATGVLP
jgi:D-alanyl-D-alanine carboxypeptidase